MDEQILGDWIADWETSPLRPLMGGIIILGYLCAVGLVGRFLGYMDVSAARRPRKQHLLDRKAPPIADDVHQYSMYPGILTTCRRDD